MKKNNFKTIIQKDHFMCGPVAVRNSMALLGVKPIGLKKLRRLCKTKSTHQGESGTWTKDLVKTLRTLGFKVKPSKKLKSSSVYIIAYTVEKDLEHFAVVKDKTIYNHWNYSKYLLKSKSKFKANEILQVTK